MYLKANKIFESDFNILTTSYTGCAYSEKISTSHLTNPKSSFKNSVAFKTELRSNEYD